MSHLAPGSCLRLAVPVHGGACPRRTKTRRRGVGFSTKVIIFQKIISHLDNEGIIKTNSTADVGKALRKHVNHPEAKYAQTRTYCRRDRRNQTVSCLYHSLRVPPGTGRACLRILVVSSIEPPGSPSTLSIRLAPTRSSVPPRGMPITARTWFSNWSHSHASYV